MKIKVIPVEIRESRMHKFDNAPDANFIPEKDVKKIKSLLPKIRKGDLPERDWQYIIRTLQEHDLITLVPEKAVKRYPVYNYIMSDRGKLIAFTNFDDSNAYIQALLTRDPKFNSRLLVYNRSMELAAATAVKQSMDLYIDYTDPDTNMENGFLCIHPLTGKIEIRFTPD